MATFDDVPRLALAQPDATELLIWETDLTFRVRDKTFAMAGDQATV